MTESIASPDTWPARLHETHRAFLERALDVLRDDARLVAVAAGGSFISGEMDAFSDLDLVLVVEPDAWDALLPEREALAAGLGPLLAAFTGEHVREPRLLICLYGPPLLHVDLKFVSLPDFGQRVEDPVLLWARDARPAARLSDVPAAYPQPDPQWIEDRFWIWVHYTAQKIERGERMETLDALAALRRMVLGPLAVRGVSAKPQGVRRIERLRPDLAPALLACASDGDPVRSRAALAAAVALYRSLRAAGPPVEARDEVERAVLAYLDGVDRVQPEV